MVALADDGKLSGRGTPWPHGLMSIAGGIGYTLPYLIPGFVTATAASRLMEVVEVPAIGWMQ